ncbi:MAG TPA: response regulator [Tepidisphaeraceae bacterium]|nr:response regulator [Tepidisphaeraceae bacterium]
MTRTVLVVDDNIDARVIASRILRHLGEEAVCVAGGAEAIEFLRHERPKLVLLDLDMPDMDGCAVVGWIRSEPDFENLPVVMFSAATEKELLAALDCGADDYLRKGSCSVDDIRSSVRQWEEPDQPQQRPVGITRSDDQFRLPEIPEKEELHSLSFFTIG